MFFIQLPRAALAPSGGSLKRIVRLLFPSQSFPGGLIAVDF
jgi:hypothetical protein